MSNIKTEPDDDKKLSGSHIIIVEKPIPISGSGQVIQESFKSERK
jgi:hypothetical protein